MGGGTGSALNTGRMEFETPLSRSAPINYELITDNGVAPATLPLTINR
jgi:hypothetical protein